jgi:hypothetical protein
MNRQILEYGACMLGAYAMSLALLTGCSSESPTTQPNAQGVAGALATPGNGTTAGTTGATTGRAGAPSTPASGTAGAVSAATGGSGSTGTTTVPTTPNTTVPTGSLPCGISSLVGQNCGTCHGATPIGGAPMPLVTLSDFHQPAKTQPTMKVYQLSHLRVTDKMRPMPPGGAMAAADVQTFDTWLQAGAQAGAATETACATPPKVPTSTGPGEGDGTKGPLTPKAGETCYEFNVHDSMTDANDKTPYDVGNGEHYEQFYFRAPWPDGSIATRYGNKIQNAQVVHHWLLFSTAELDAEGSHKTSPLPTLNGVNAQLLAGWAVGGTNLAMPDDVGFELPPNGTTLNAQWHFYNNTGTRQTDASSLQICTMPAGSRPHTAAIVWTGTEDLKGNIWTGGPGMPAHQESTFTGTCDPLRAGMNASEPIHIVAFWPHMHQLGTSMQAIVNHKDGTKEKIFDKPFDFNNQVHYFQPYDLAAGDTLTTNCTFNNTTDRGIPFGESSDSEMCYLFTFAWPAHALENNVISLIGATNTCW